MVLTQPTNVPSNSGSMFDAHSSNFAQFSPTIGDESAETSPVPRYFVQEPNFKRHHEVALIDTSSDEEMDAEMTSEQKRYQATEPFIEEPDEQDFQASKKIRLDERLQKFLARARSNTQLLPRVEKVRGDEMVLWQAPIPRNPSISVEDLTIPPECRIRELTEEEEVAELENFHSRQLLVDGMNDDESNNNEYLGIIEFDTGSDGTAQNSPGGDDDFDSPIPSPPIIQDVTEDFTSSNSLASLPSDSLTDEDLMEYE